MKNNLLVPEDPRGRPTTPGIRPEAAATIRPETDGSAGSAGRKRRRLITGLAVAVVVVGGVALIWHKTHAGPQTRNGTGGGHGGHSGGFGLNGPLPVVVQAARKGNLPVFLNGLGTVTPLATVTIRTQISGVLTEIDFQEGQTVKKGDLLAVIDPRPYQVALEQAQGQLKQAQAQLAEAQADLSRYETLAKQDSIAQQQVDAQRALVTQDQGLCETDQAAIDSANLNLTYCHITAPVEGKVGLRQVDAGNYVTPGDANGLVVLAQIEPITVIFTLPEDNIQAVAERLGSGDAIPVTAYDRDQTRKLASGQISAIDNEVDPTTGTFKLRALFDNDDDRLFPSQFVNARMLLDVRRGATIIPTSAIERGDQGTFVYLVKPDNTVAAQPVTLGDSEGESVVVTKGLAVGNRVVTDGADKLKDGMTVIPQTPAGAAAGAGGGHRHHADGSGAGDSGSGGWHRASGDSSDTPQAPAQKPAGTAGGSAPAQ